MKNRILAVLAAVVVIAGGAWFVVARKGSAEPKYRKAKLDKGDVVSTVTATGSLSAVTTVKVGSQVSGIIAKLYVDFNSTVKKGQLLAELDPTPFLVSVEQRRADLDKAKVELRNTELSLTRAKNLTKQQLLAQSELDAAQTNRDAAAAAVAQSEASLKQALTNLSYAKIASPIDGVVVDRQYDVGQTVAASFQAPVIFTIAQDLTKMQVLTNIDEADVGRVRVEQVASFSVDAFPEQSFKGSVSQIRLSPQTVQNVVTYPVILDVPNQDLKLKPGMTANVQIPVDARRDVLRVPNAALRFRPDPADVAGADKTKGVTAGAASSAAPAPASSSAATGAPAPQTGAPQAGSRGAGGRGGPGGGGGRGAWSGGAGGAGRPAASRSGTLYVEVPNGKGKLKAVTVRTLITDGNMTAIESADVKEGDEIILGLATARASSSGSGSPAGGGGPGGGGRRPF
ncbi:MAG: efflux RND transporter periplasmic adaptor subunit [Acidobacteria bacterium]|nr:efflux RND transporter periplasmic adaptor subunit [Acidobacteriota bacterium]